MSAKYLTCYAIERELKFLLKKQMLLKETKKFPALELESEFKKLCQRKTYMAIEDVRILLDQLGVPTRQYHIDAVLRRCDHDADWKISFDEFLETIGRTKFDIIDQKKLFEERKKEEKKIMINRNVDVA